MCIRDRVTEVLLDDFMKKMGLKQKIQRPKKKSALELKIEEIHNFYEEMDKLQKLTLIHILTRIIS